MLPTLIFCGINFLSSSGNHLVVTKCTPPTAAEDEPDHRPTAQILRIMLRQIRPSLLRRVHAFDLHTLKGLPKWHSRFEPIKGWRGHWIASMLSQERQIGLHLFVRNSRVVADLMKTHQDDPWPGAKFRLWGNEVQGILGCGVGNWSWPGIVVLARRGDHLVEQSFFTEQQEGFVKFKSGTQDAICSVRDEEHFKLLGACHASPHLTYISTWRHVKNGFKPGPYRVVHNPVFYFDQLAFAAKQGYWSELCFRIPDPKLRKRFIREVKSINEIKTIWCPLSENDDNGKVFRFDSGRLFFGFALLHNHWKMTRMWTVDNYEHTHHPMFPL